MTDSQNGTDVLLNRVAAGDSDAVNVLLNRHRGQLRKMISLRLDKRVAGRVDPSDIIQDTLAVAASRLDSFAHERPLPFYPWLRQIAIALQWHRG